MKKVIALAVVIIATLLFAKFYQFESVGIVENSAFVLTDNVITQNLMKDQLEPEKAAVQPEILESMSPLYERGGSLYAGERKNELNTAYPLFLNDSAVILNINDSAKLVTKEFKKVNSYYGLYVSDGVSFNADRQRADAEEFILLELINKMYINAQQMEVHTVCGDVQVAMNSIINFQEDSIRYYTLSDGQFNYGLIMKLDEQAFVRFGDQKYAYFELLKKLGKLDERIRDYRLEETEPPLPKEPEVLEEDEPSLPEEPQRPEKSEAEEKPEEETSSEPELELPKAPEAPKPLSYRKPRVTMSKFRIDREKKLARTTITINDPSGALTDVIKVTLCDPKENMQVWTFADYAEAQKGVLETTATFENLECNMDYSANGTFSYFDRNGQIQTEMFGLKTFRLKEYQQLQTDNLVGEPPVPVYKRPLFSCKPFTAGIYDLSSELTITEQGSLIGGVRFEIYRGERLYMRKIVSTAGKFKIGALPPATEYKIVGSFAYYNQYKMKIEEKFLEQTISTLPLENLAPMTLSFKNGRFLHDRIQLVDLSFADDPAKSPQKVGFETIPYVTKIAVQIENSLYSLNTLQLSTMLNGGKVAYETPAVLRSNKEYEYTFRCFDRFGNELPLTEPAVGNTHTCKAPPTGTIQFTCNEVANVELSVQIENKDQVEMQNCRIMLYDISGNIVPTIIKMADEKDSPPATQHALPDNGGEIVFTNLAAGEVYTAVVYCDYDLDNGVGIQADKEISHTRFTTLPISALGYAIFNTNVSELTDISALLNITLDKNRINQSLIFLLDKVTATITAPDGAEIMSVSLTGDELQGLKEGMPLQMQPEHLCGATEYQITIAAEVEQGSIRYDIKTSNSIEKFKTLKTEPQVAMSSYFVVSNSIELYDVLIDDPHGAVLGNVNLLVSDSYGKIAGMSILQANTVYDKLSFAKLRENETYTFTFIATELNKGYDYTTYQTLYQLKPVYQIMNENRLSGKIGLQSLDEIAGDKEHFNAKLRVQITDEKKDLFDDPRYTIKVFKEGEAVNTFARTINPAGANVDSIFYYQVDALSEYCLELWVEVHGHELKLDETTFTTEQKIIGLATIKDFSQLGSNPTGKFIVLNDIELTAGPWRFNGELDFQGYTLTSTKGYYLFNELSKNGVLKNMVLDLTIPYTDPIRYRGFIAYNSYGRMQNIMVNVKGCTEFLHNDWGIFCRANGNTGVIENFVVNLESPLNAWTNFGTVAAFNSGVVRNGYVYGTDIQLPNIAVDGGYTASNYGGIVGVNYIAGQVENVFNLVNIRTGTEVTPTNSNFGMIVGLNSGIVKGAFTTGEVYFGDSLDLRYGPAVGSQNGKLQTSAYYISENSTYKNTYNAKVTKETLYDPLWHHHVLGKAFEIDEPVLLGYYPQLKMPAYMPAQPYLPLSELGVANSVDLASVMVEEQHEDYAIAVFTFKNPYGYTIKNVAVEYLHAKVIEGTQVDKDELSRVQVRLDTPTNYFSSYSVMYIGYAISSSGTPTIRSYAKGERLINAEFFKPIRTIEEWTAIQDKMDQNYRLKEDLDFNNVPQASIRLGKSDGVQFIGKLDGGIYDENGNITGLHTIKNIDLSGGLGGVITNLKGSVSNLRVEKLILESPKEAYVGFVRRTQSGALINNVHLDGIRVQGSNMVGGIVGQCYYAVVQNCSVNRLVLKDASTNVRAGGIAGQTSYSTVTNCYVYALDIRIEIAQIGDAAGGIVGYADNSEIGNCYAVGSIRTKIPNVGGLIGRAASGCEVRNMWSDVDVITNVDYIGGMVGFYSGGASEIVPTNTLVLGDLYSSVTTSVNVRRMMGNRTDMENAYAWSGQRINGQIPYEPDGITMAGDGAEVLSGELLRQSQTFIKKIEMGSSFDYAKVSEAILPQLYGTDGNLLPYQTDHKLDENPLIQIADITAATVGNQYIIQIKLFHQKGITIENATFDYLNVSTEVFVESDVSTKLFCTLDGAPERYLDSYQLNGIKYNGGQIFTILAQISFENPFYIDIPNVSTWQAVMAERKNNFENFRITGNLDFGNRPDIVYNVNVNRIVGSIDAEGQYTTIKNILIAFPDTSQGFINTVNAGVNNLRFENISLTNKKSGGSNVGVIGKCLGNIENITFYNVTINALSASQVGCIGNSGGNITGASIERVNVKTTSDYVGGLVGRVENGLLSKLSAKETVVSGRSQVGSLAGRVIGDVSYSTADTVTVTGTGSYTGGITGYTYPIIAGDMITNEELSVKNSRINGISYVGGIFGQGQLRNDNAASTCSRVDNMIIIGTGGYVGGLAGIPGVWNNRNGLVSNCQIFGGYNVGGGMGNISALYRVFVLDSTISTIYDQKYGELTGYAVPSPTSSTQNRYIGGIFGYAGLGGPAAVGCGVTNCIIGAEGADNVGGIGGHIGSGGRDCFSQDSTVYGRNNIGGIVGYHRISTVYSCQSNAEVIASGENAGGIAGYMYINRELDGTNIPRLVANYYVGNVSANDYAGGLVGRTSAELYGDNSRLIVAANVTADGSHGNIIGNLAGGSFTYLRVYNGSVLNVGGVSLGKAADIYASVPQSSAGMMLVTSAQLKAATTYTSLGSYFATGYRNYTSLNYNYMPYLTYRVFDGTTKTMPYQEGKDGNGTYNPVNSYQGGIPIPTEPDAFLMMSRGMAAMAQELPVPDFYAVGADKLNIEFNTANEFTRFIVAANGNELFEQRIEKRVYSLNYDFVTPLTVTIKDGFHEEQYDVNPVPLRRDIITWDTDYYCITNLGVQSGKSGLLAGNFIHLYNGQGLTASGKLCNLADGEIIQEAVGIALCEEAQSLYSFNYTEYRIKTYKNHSESTYNGQTVTRELQLLVKNGSLSVLDPALPIRYDGVIVDSASGTDYMTVLGTDGMLMDMKEPLHLPRDFKNSNIVQMSNNMQCSSPYAVVRYENGSVVAFNYLTGEILSTEFVKSDMTLLEYAQDFLNAKLNLVQSDLSKGYLQIAELKEELTILPYTEDLEAGDKIDGGKLAGTSDKQKADGNKTGGESAGSGKSAGEGEEKTESKQKLGTAGEKDLLSGNAETEIEKADKAAANSNGEKYSGGESDVENSVAEKFVDGKTTDKAIEGTVTENITSNGVSAENKNEVAQGIGTFDKQGSTENTPGKSPIGDTSNAKASNTKASNAPQTEAVGTLAKPEKQMRKYVAVYDAKTGEYLLYEEKNMLQATNAHLTPVNVQQVNKVLKNEKSTQGIQTVLYENKGILLLFLIAISIIALLLYIYYKKYRM